MPLLREEMADIHVNAAEPDGVARVQLQYFLQMRLGFGPASIFDQDNAQIRVCGPRIRVFRQYIVIAGFGILERRAVLPAKRTQRSKQQEDRTPDGNASRAAQMA